jgi:SOS-response transcriptional repressor LexA
MTKPKAKARVGNDGLTDRQRDVLRLHGEGKNPTQIGEELGISSQGVHGHLRRLRGKGLIEGTARTAPVPVAVPDNGRPLTAADALEQVRQAAATQRQQLADRKAQIASEITSLNAQDAEIDAALAELDAMLGTKGGTDG